MFILYSREFYRKSKPCYTAYFFAFEVFLAYLQKSPIHVKEEKTLFIMFIYCLRLETNCLSTHGGQEPVLESDPYGAV
jgi:hypothetical protein